MKHVRVKTSQGEYVSIADMGGGRITATIPSQGGKFTPSLGWGDVCNTTTADFLNWRSTVGMIEFHEGEDNIVSISKSENESLFITCWGLDYQYLGYVTNHNVIENTRYIKIYLQNTSANTSFQPISITLVLSHTFNYIKNVAPLCQLRSFAFQVQIRNDNEQSSSNSYAGINEIHYDNGYFYLPKNYTHDGNPVPLVIFVHGTHQHDWGAVTAPEYGYDNFYKFLCYNGYAVADCSGVTDKYHFTETTEDECKSNPMSLSCFIQMYDWMVRNFNIDASRCYVSGKSAGGQMATLLGYSKLPVRAVGEMAPSLNTLSEDARRCTPTSLNFCLRRFGMTNPNFPQGMYTDWASTYKQQILDNIDLFHGYEPFTVGTDVDTKTITQLLYNYKYDAVNNDTVWALVNTVHKQQPFPMKVWISENDLSTPIYYVRMYKKMVDNAGGICKLRVVPSKESTMEGHLNCEHSDPVNYKTKFNGTVSVPFVFAEIVDWFNLY